MQNYAATLKLQNGKNVMGSKGWKKWVKCVIMKGCPNTTLGFPREFCSYLKATKILTHLKW